jgi:hypothetical protein
MTTTELNKANIEKLNIRQTMLDNGDATALREFYGHDVFGMGHGEWSDEEILKAAAADLNSIKKSLGL